jgi:hypothetical protein
VESNTLVLRGDSLLVLASATDATETDGLSSVPIVAKHEAGELGKGCVMVEVRRSRRKRFDGGLFSSGTGGLWSGTLGDS